MKVIEKIDTRKLSRETREHMRYQCIKLRSKGISRNEVAEILGVNLATISIWWSIYKREGAKVFKLGVPGKKEGTGRLLNKEQEKEIQRLLVDKTPEQLKFPFALWNRRAVKLLIKREFLITVSIRAVGDYLKRWGFTPQKPLKKAYEQDNKKVDKWLKEEYPLIKKQAKLEKAEIHWGDETGLRSDTQHGRGYAPKGKTPIQKIPAKRTSTNLISSITNQGKVRFMGYRGSMNAAVLIKFLGRLIKASKKKIFLILDNLRVHHSKVVKEWLEKHKKKIEIFYLPAYSPELNPDEYLNCDLKAGVHSMVPAKTQDTLVKNVLSHMRKLQKSPDRVKSYFNHPKIAYAAANENSIAA